MLITDPLSPNQGTTAQPRNSLLLNQGAECSTPEPSHHTTREQNAQPQKQATVQQGSRCMPLSNEGAECSTQKQATIQRGSRILNPKAGHCPMQATVCSIQKQATVCSIQKHATIQRGSRMLNPKAGHHSTREQNALTRSRSPHNPGAWCSTRKLASQC